MATQSRRTSNGSRRQMLRGKYLLRVGLVLLVAVTVCGFLDRPDIKGFGFNYFERFSSRVQIAIASRRNPDLMAWARRQVVLVPISEATFARTSPNPIPGPPVPRNYHARVIDSLTRAGAGVIAFDLVFDLASEESEKDSSLAEAARRSGRVVWASVLDEKQSPPQLIPPIPSLLAGSHHFGHINVPQNSEEPEVTSIKPIVESGDEQPVRAFGVEAALMKLHLASQPARRDSIGWQIGKVRIPVDESGLAKVSFLGWSSESQQDTSSLPQTPYKTLSGSTKEDYFLRVPYEDLYTGHTDWSQFRDKVVIIGDITAVGNDFRNTSIGYMWGPEIHAHVVTSLLMAAQRGYPIAREATPLTNLIVLAVMSALVCVLAAVWRLQWAAIAAVVLLLGYYGVNLWLFTNDYLVLHTIAPTASVILVLVGMLTERGLTEEHERKRMKTLLQRYISEELAEYVTAHPEKSYLGGERVTATVLFSDIRGFTSLSEKMPPEAVLGLLNEYMETMTTVIYNYDGYVDKFVGDGIMAVFGVPAPSLNHGFQAVAAAIDMQAKLLELQHEWRRRGLPELEIGIGINTGDMIFGNYGSSRRSDFSVIGDAVNLASRVETQNREWQTRILITEATYQFVKDRARARGPLPAYLRGREDVVNLYEIFGWVDAEAVEPVHAPAVGHSL